MANIDDLQSELINSIQAMDCDSVKQILDRYGVGHQPIYLDLPEAVLAGVKTGHSEIVRLLLRNKSVDVMRGDKYNRRPIHYAAEMGSVSVVHQIIRAGSAVNIADGQGHTALHYAVRSGHAEVVSLLIKEGAHVNRAKTFFYGETPLHLAAKSGRTDVVNVLLARGADMNAATLIDSTTPLHKAVSGHHFHVAKILSDSGANLQKVDSNGRTALHIAAEEGIDDIACILIQKGADINFPDAKGRTPLHYATLMCQLSVMRTLTNSQIYVNVRDHEGFTPLHSACLAGHVEATKLLIRVGAELNALEYSWGNSPLFLAIVHNRLDVARVLIDGGADINLGDKDASMPLHRIQAVRGKDKVEVCQRLIDRGAFLNTRTKQGYTPLDRCVFQYVIGNYSQEMLRILVVSGALLKPQAQGSLSIIERKPRNSPMCWLVWRGDLESARFLVNVGWELRQEKWVYLVGKTAEQTSFLLWVQQLLRQPVRLMQLCRSCIREQLLLSSGDRQITDGIGELPLPKFLKYYLMFQEEVAAFVSTYTE